MFGVSGTKIMVPNILYRFGEFCTVIQPVLCTARRSNIDPCHDRKVGKGSGDLPAQRQEK